MPHRDPSTSVFDGVPTELVPTPPENAALADAVRELVDACVRTEVAGSEVSDVTEQVRALTARLRTHEIDQPRGLLAGGEGRRDNSANPTVGRRNPIAPPLALHLDTEKGRVSCELEFGLAYEGPPGSAHGGLIAAALDQILGAVPFVVGRPGLTAYLTITYRKRTPLRAKLVGEAWVDRQEGYKTYVRGHLIDPDGDVTAQAEGLFVTPRAARGPGALPQGDDAGDLTP